MCQYAAGRSGFALRHKNKQKRRPQLQLRTPFRTKD
nr:MAG TPA: hypothetical protein [Caudoviricetes sp.]